MADPAQASWLASSIGEYAAVYAKTSYVLPLHGIVAGKCTCGKYPCGENNKQAGKHPFTRHGLKDASNDIEVLGRLFDYRVDLNIGILCGEKSNLLVLDVDEKRDGHKSLIDLIRTYGEFPPTIIIKTGGGFHYYFNYPKGANIGNRTDFMPGLDIKSDNGYVVAAPSNHFSGVRYARDEKSTDVSADPPLILLEMLQAKKKQERQPLSSDHSTGGYSEWSREEVQRMLDVLDASMDYNSWLTVGLALHSAAMPLSLWDSWSRTSEKYQNGDCEKRWHDFTPNGGVSMGTLVHMATQNGWKPKSIERELIDVSVA